ncbi:right-handed parallel beta-helix repeat-containing protein [bacterium]|nr:right-handed parallel beta-helix repeat-containing protein [bacterium]
MNSLSKLISFGLIAVFLFFGFGCADDDEGSVSYHRDSVFTSDATTDATTDIAQYSIGGTISGLSGSGLILQNNGGEELTVESGATSFTFSATVLDAVTYSVTVKTHAAGQGCSVTNNSGKVSGANATDIAINCSTILVSPLYSNNGSDWMDYVKNDGSSSISATDTACGAGDGPGYAACLHGGEMRTVSVTGKDICTGLTATDALGVFNWSCDSGSNPVRMVSMGFNKGKYLSDLIDFATPAWRSNSVTISDNGTNYIISSTSIWWANSLAVNNSGGSLSTAGTIYLVDTDVSVASYIFNNSKVGLVVKPGSSVTLSSSDGVTSTNSSFGWIEGQFKGGTSATIHLNTQSTFYTFRNVKVANSGVDGIVLDGSNTRNNYLSDIIAANCAQNGIKISTSANNNILQNVRAFNNGYFGIGLTNSNSNTLVNNTIANNQQNGLRIDSSPNIMVLNLTAMNDSASDSHFGVSVASTNGTLLSGLSTGNNWNGLGLESVGYTTIQHLLTARNFSASTGWGIRLNNATNNYFTGSFKTGGNRIDCSVFNTYDGIDGSCNPTNVSDFILTTGINLATIFLAQITSDLINSSEDASGQATYDASLDWFNFENSFRSWGNAGSIFPNNDNRSRCSSGTCQIWDWSVASADTVILDVLSLKSTGDAANTITHKWYLATPPTGQNDCTGAFIGSEYTGTTNTGCQSTFLRNAVEIIGDKIGNENGLCESDETCLHTPNIGSYQGHGNLISAGGFTNGNTLTGITLKRFNANGR